jgi:hypothetical protein
MFMFRRYLISALATAGLVGAILLVAAIPARGQEPCTADENCTVKTSMVMDAHRTGMFEGPKANTGFATHSKKDGKSVLTLSEDFVVPETPAPHWQVVDSEGNVYLLNRLKIKEDKYNQTITLPGYIRDVAKVQIWCAWAETLLGEASFEKPVM